MGNLYFEAHIDADQLRKELRDINTRIKNFSDNVQKQGATIDTTFKRIGAGLATYFTFTAAKVMISDIIKVRGEFQQLDIALTTMIGNKEEADRLMRQVVQYAATTPFNLTDIGQGVKQLKAYQFEVKELIPTLNRLGNVAAGLSVPLNDLIYLYGTSRAQGRLFARDIQQFAGRGVPIISELSKILKVAEKDVMDLVSAGKVGFPELEKVFQNLTDEGGMFFDLMDKQSQSITGRISNVQDAWDQMLNQIGQENEGVIYRGIGFVGTLIDNYEELLDVLKILVATYGSYRAAILLVNIAQKAQVVMGAVQAWFQLARGIKTAKDAQIAFNLATKANPFGLIAAAIAAVVTSLALFSKEAKTAADIQESLNTSLKNLEKFDEIERIREDYDKLNNKTEKTADEQERYNEYIQQLSRYYPEVIEQVNRYGEAIELVSKKIEKASRKQREALVQEQKDNLQIAKETLNNLEVRKIALERLTQLSYTVQRSNVNTRTGTFTTYEEDVKTTAESRAKARDELIKIEQEIGNINGNIREFETNLSLLEGKQVDWFKKYSELFINLEDVSQAKLKSIRGKLEGLLSDVRIKDDEFLNAVKNQLKGVDDLLAGAGIVTEKNVKYYEQVIKDAKEAIDSLTVDDKDLLKKRNEQLQKIQEAESKISQIRGKEKKGKSIYEEELDQVKDAFEKYSKLQDETLKEQFLKENEYLTKGQKSWEDYLIWRYGKAQEFGEKIAIELAASQDDIRVKQVDYELKPIKPLEAEQIVGSGILERYDAQISELNEKIQKERDKQRLQDLARERDYLEEKKNQLLNYEENASAIYEKLFGDISKMRNDELRKLLDESGAELQKLNAQYAQENSKTGSARDEAKILRLHQQILEITKQRGEIEKEINQNTIDSLQGISDTFRELSDLAGMFDEDLGELLGKMAEFADGAKDVFSGIASNNPFQIIQGGVKIIKSLITQEVISDTQRYERAIKNLESAFKDLNHQLDRAKGTDKIASREAIIKSLQRQREEYEKMIQAELNATKVTRFLGIKIGEKSATDWAKIEEWKEQIKELERETENALDELTEFITGTTTESIAKSIIDAFVLGEDAAKSFEQTAVDVIRNIVLQSIMLNFLEKPIQEAIDKLMGEIYQEREPEIRERVDQTYDRQQAKRDEEAADREEEGRRRELATYKQPVTPSKPKQEGEKELIDLSSPEAKQSFSEFAEAFVTAGKNAQEIAEELDAALRENGWSLFGGADKESGLAGAIRREITEETGTELLGLWNRTSLDMRDMKNGINRGLEIQLQHINHAAAIELNTFNTVAELKNAVSRLDKIVENTDSNRRAAGG